MEYSQNIKELFKRYLNNECSTEETRYLMSLFNVSENEELLKKLIIEELENQNILPPEPDAGTKGRLERIFRIIQGKTNQGKK